MQRDFGSGAFAFPGIPPNSEVASNAPWASPTQNLNNLSSAPSSGSAPTANSLSIDQHEMCRLAFLDAGIHDRLLDLHNLGPNVSCTGTLASDIASLD